MKNGEIIIYIFQRNQRNRFSDSYISSSQERVFSPNITKDIEMNNETYRSFWEFIAEWLPGYSSRDDVLESDILTRYVRDEEVWEEDLTWINQYYGGDKQLVAEQLMNLEAKFAKESLAAYYENMLKK